MIIFYYPDLERSVYLNLSFFLTYVSNLWTVIPVNKLVSLYKILAIKAKQLHMLGMSYEAIGRSLKIGQETARMACHYEGWKTHPFLTRPLFLPRGLFAPLYHDGAGLQISCCDQRAQRAAQQSHRNKLYDQHGQK